MVRRPPAGGKCCATLVPVIIVAGCLTVDPSDRDSYLSGCRDVIVAARAADGCVAFHLAADPVEPDRINVFEQWTSVEAVEAFRGSGPIDEQWALVRTTEVFEHEVASTIRL